MAEIIEIAPLVYRTVEAAISAYIARTIARLVREATRAPPPRRYYRIMATLCFYYRPAPSEWEGRRRKVTPEVFAEVRVWRVIAYPFDEERWRRRLTLEAWWVASLYGSIISAELKGSVHYVREGWEKEEIPPYVTPSTWERIMGGVLEVRPERGVVRVRSTPIYRAIAFYKEEDRPWETTPYIYGEEDIRDKEATALSYIRLMPTPYRRWGIDRIKEHFATLHRSGPLGVSQMIPYLWGSGVWCDSTAFIKTRWCEEFMKRGEAAWRWPPPPFELPRRRK